MYIYMYIYIYIIYIYGLIYTHAEEAAAGDLKRNSFLHEHFCFERKHASSI